MARFEPPFWDDWDADKLKAEIAKRQAKQGDLLLAKEAADFALKRNSDEISGMQFTLICQLGMRSVLRGFHGAL